LRRYTEAKKVEKLCANQHLINDDDDFDPMAGRCRLTVSNPELKACLDSVPALESTMW
jgi:hypothetical protein